MPEWTYYRIFIPGPKRYYLFGYGRNTHLRYIVLRIPVSAMLAGLHLIVKDEMIRENGK